MEQSKLKTPGQIYGNFKLNQVLEIKELQATLKELVHLPTGAHIMHIENEDPENLFCLSFQTLPYSSNGVAHILEHTVLCGSKKFPIKDPFFAMNRRSLNTFMNALTGADFTCYPAASQNPQDFYNLLEVYLDAVFHPKLDHLSFLQEGHRLEFANPLDSKTNLEYKGIVFNEMKGALSSADARLQEAMNFELFPNITYGYNSGGDPKEIPTLTHEELLAFHKNYYHPSRCLFYFYGNIPIENHLDFIEKNAFVDVEALPPLPPPSLQPRFHEKKSVDLTYPIASDESTENKTLISFGWLTCNILDQEEILALSVIEIILMDSDASLLKRALMNSKLCKQASCFIETDYTEIPLIITLRGCNPESKDPLMAIINETLKKIVKEGISETSIENALHRLEFYRSEITGDHTPFGLSLFFRSGLIKQHGADAKNGLMIHSTFDKLRNLILKNPNYLTDLIQKYLIDNQHFVTITMRPDRELAAKEIADELESLQKIRSKYTEDEMNLLVKQAQDLINFQKDQEDEDLSILPKVNLEDVEKNIRNYPLKKEELKNLTLYHHECFTNGIVYADLTYQLPRIEENDLSLVRLFTILLTQVGTKKRNYLEQIEYIQAKTGGISSSLALNPQATNSDIYFPSLHIHGKALHRYSKNLFEIIVDIVSSADFDDRERVKEIILKHYTSLQSAFNQNALKYAINLSSSQINSAGAIVNDWYGIRYFETIQKIATNIDETLEPLIEKLKEFQKKLLCLKGQELIVSSDENIYQELKNQKFYGLQDLSLHSFEPWLDDYLIPKIPSQARIIPSPIAFIGKVFKTLPYSHEDSAILSVSSFLLDNLYLHQKIREQGGAYGGGAVCNTMAGTFYFYSYRDPNILSTLNAFQESIQMILNGEFDNEDLIEAKLEMIQGMDSPVSPGSRAYLAYSWLKEGKTDLLRQNFRDKVLSLTKEMVIEAIKTHLLPNFELGKTIVFAGKELIEKENRLLIEENKDPFPIRK